MTPTTKTRIHGALIVTTYLILVTAPFINFVGRLVNILLPITGLAALTFCCITRIYAIITGQWPKIKESPK